MPGGNVDLSRHIWNCNYLLEKLPSLLPSYVQLKLIYKCSIEVSFVITEDWQKIFKNIPVKEISINPEDKMDNVISSIMYHIAEHSFEAGAKRGKKLAAKDLLKRLGIDPKEL